VRDRLNFDCDDELRAGCVIASLLVDHPEVRVRRSPGGRGYHVVVDSAPDLVKRWELGDCLGRLHGDMKRAKAGLPTGILFMYKNGRFASRWVRVRAIDVGRWSAR
jgi:hypothetical protein